MSKKYQKKSSSKSKKQYKQMYLLNKSGLNYSALFATYYDPNDLTKVVIRTTVVITDLRTNQMVESKEWWIDDGISMDEIFDITLTLVKKYNTKLSLNKDPVPLEKCQNTKCGGICGDYLYEFIYSDKAPLPYQELLNKNKN